MTRELADLTLGLNGQARAVLAMLSEISCDGLSAYDEARREYDVEIKTSAWYNGRERGVCLEVRAWFTDPMALFITFGENRTSDSIFVDSWEVECRLLNPPTVRDFPDEAYEARTFVPYGDVAGAVKVIRDKIAGFVAGRVKDAEALVVHAGPARVLPELGEEAQFGADLRAGMLSESVVRATRARKPRRLGA